MTILQKTSLSSLVASIPAIVVVILILSVAHGSIDLSMSWEFAILLTIFTFYILPFLLAILYFGLFKYTWKRISNNTSDTVTDFRWIYAIVSFVCMVVIIYSAFWTVNKYLIYHKESTIARAQIAREDEKQKLANEKLLIQKPLAAKISPNFIVTKDEDVMYQGEVYPTIRIGNQRWFAKSLNVPTPGYHACEDYWHNKNCPPYGVYTWYEATNSPTGELPVGATLVQGICPAGWHIPSNEEFITLETTLLNSCDSSRAIEYSDARFSCIPIGDMLKKEEDCFTQQNCNRSLFSVETSEYEQNYQGESLPLGNEGYIWTSTRAPLYVSAITRGFSKLDAGIKFQALNIGDKGQVRCLQDQ